jgi:4-amino-4-deoxy-L-arabinose transferase-like glycosyltransferase
MRRRSRTRRVLKWVAAAMCALILAAWALSVQYAFTNAPDGRPQTVRVLISQGEILIGWQRPFVRQDYADIDDFIVPALGKSSRVGWPWPAFYTDVSGGTTYRSLVIPLWFMFLLAFPAAASLWWLDRHRVRPGHCWKCGYDLTGNVSGQCPECGTAVASHGRERAGWR